MNIAFLLKGTEGHRPRFRKTTLPANLNFRCDACHAATARTGGPKNEHLQVCTKYGRRGVKIVPVAYQYMCGTCADELKKAATGAKKARGDSETRRKPEISEARALQIAESYLGDCESLARRSLSVEQVKKAILKSANRPGYLRAIPSDILANDPGELRRKGVSDGN